MLIAGVDNGLDGGIALIKNGMMYNHIPMPTINTVKNKREYDMTKIKNFLASVEHVFIEQAQAMPGQGVSSMFTIGKNYGIMMGLLAGLGYPFTIVAPQTWQKVMFSGFPKSNTKSVSVLVCQRLWPNEDWRASERCKVAHDGMTDAALIAEYGRRSLHDVAPAVKPVVKYDPDVLTSPTPRPVKPVVDEPPEPLVKKASLARKKVKKSSLDSFVDSL